MDVAASFLHVASAHGRDRCGVRRAGGGRRAGEPRRAGARGGARAERRRQGAHGRGRRTTPRRRPHGAHDALGLRRAVRAGRAPPRRGRDPHPLHHRGAARLRGWRAPRPPPRRRSLGRSHRAVGRLSGGRRLPQVRGPRRRHLRRGPRSLPRVRQAHGHEPRRHRRATRAADPRADRRAPHHVERPDVDVRGPTAPRPVRALRHVCRILAIRGARHPESDRARGAGGSRGRRGRNGAPRRRARHARQRSRRDLPLRDRGATPPPCRRPGTSTRPGRCCRGPSPTTGRPARPRRGGSRRRPGRGFRHPRSCCGDGSTRSA